MADISLTRAKRMINATFAKGKDLNLNPLSAVVLDAGGNVKAFERQDGASPGRFAIAQGKAYGCVMLGMTGTQQMARAEQQAYFVNAVNGAMGGQVIPLPGGVLIKDKRGVTLGAIGVTGDSSDNDALAGVAGVESTGLFAEA